MKNLLTLNHDGRLALRSGGVETVLESCRTRNVLLLVDTSGSMSGDKIEQAKRGAAGFALSAQEKGYATGLAVFADRAAMITDPTDAASLIRNIHGLRTGFVGGSTYLANGLVLANKFPDLSAVVIITDGAANDPRQALAAVQPLKARGIEILCIGTDDADQDFLAQLATRSDLAQHVTQDQMASAIADVSRLLEA